MQRSRTSDMVFSVSRHPASLRPGDVVTSHIEGIGTLRNRCVAAS